MSSTKQRKRLNNFDVHETLYQINLSFEDYKYSNIHICVFWKCRVWWNSHSWFHVAWAGSSFPSPPSALSPTPELSHVPL